MNWPLVFAIVAGVIALVAAVRLFLAPIRLLLRLVINSVLGLAFLWLINLAGGFFNLHIGLNPVTAITVGLLGIPGAVLLLVLHYIAR